MLSAVNNAASASSADDRVAAALVFAVAHVENHNSVAYLMNGSIKVDALDDTKIQAQFGKGTKAVYSSLTGIGSSEVKADT